MNELNLQNPDFRRLIKQIEMVGDHSKIYMVLNFYVKFSEFSKRGFFLCGCNGMMNENQIWFPTRRHFSDIELTSFRCLETFGVDTGHCSSVCIDWQKIYENESAEPTKSRVFRAD